MLPNCVGGDQWDAKIRRQIKNCDLFIPVVSTTTQNRREAYFQLEWKLADDRTHMMAPGTPFIVPVVIDDTPEYEAAVPESFTKTQFTRLPRGEPTPKFVADVKRLATDPNATTSASTSSRPVAAPSTPVTPPKKSPVLMIVGMSITGVIVLMGMMMWYASSNKKTTESRITDAMQANEAAFDLGETADSDRLNIAVLPFANMSDDPSANSFFADGVHEDLLTNLSYVPQLKVVSRTSVMQYRDTTKPVKQIAAELGVGTLLESSVRRAGDQVRVTAQLIDASTDEHLWAQNYDRKLEDIFAIQGELATAITNALRVALTDEQVESFAERPTENLEAYELYLKEQELQEREGNTEERQFQSIAMMQKAVGLDPDFALAWANLDVLHAQEHFWNRDPAEAHRALASRAIERALALAPGNLDVMTHIGSYHYYAYRDYAKAAEYYQKVLDVAPNHVDAIASMGFIRRREGQWAESLRYHEKALELDPRNVSVITGLTTTYPRLRQWDKAAALQQILVERNPGDILVESQLACFEAERDNRLQPYHDMVARYPDLAEGEHSFFYNYRMQRAVLERNWDRFIDLHENAPSAEADANGYAFSLAMVLKITGREIEATEVLDEIIDEATESVEKYGASVQLFRLAFAQALNGDLAESRNVAQEYTDYLAEQNDAMDEAYGAATLTVISVWTDLPAQAINQLRAFLRKPAPQFFSRFKLSHELWLYPCGIRPSWRPCKPTTKLGHRCSWNTCYV